MKKTPILALALAALAIQAEASPSRYGMIGLTPGETLRINVANPELSMPSGGLPTIHPSLLRYAWKDETGPDQFFDILATAVGRQRTVEGFIRQIRERLALDPAQTSKPVELIAVGTGNRPFGPKP